jgi:hypothetical protein
MFAKLPSTLGSKWFTRVITEVRVALVASASVHQRQAADNSGADLNSSSSVFFSNNA